MSLVSERFKEAARVRVVSDSCYHGQEGTLKSQNGMNTRWMVAIDGDPNNLSEISFYEHELEGLANVRPLATPPLTPQDDAQR